MTTITASTVTFSPLSSPVKGLGKFTHSYPLRVSMACDGRRVQSKALLSQESRRKPITHSTLCAAAATMTTQTVKPEVPTITPVSDKKERPQLTDGWDGPPPPINIDDGGGGEKFSGGFILFGFLVFLAFLKEL